MRTCGECTLCCKLLAIRELEKPAYKWCSHCNVGQGCSIYEKRPQSCRDFECLWLQDEAIPEDLKPCDVKAVMATNQTGEVIQVHVDPANPDVWQKGRLGSFLQLIGQKIPVIVVCGDKRKLIVPEAVAKEGITFREEQVDGTVIEWKGKR